MESLHLLTAFWSAFALAAIVGGLVLAWAISKQRKRREEEPPRTSSSSP